MSTCCSLLFVLTLGTVFFIITAESQEATSHYMPGCTNGKRFRSKCYKLGESIYGNGELRDCDKAVITDDAENEFIKDTIYKTLETGVWIGIDRGNPYDKFRYGGRNGKCVYFDRAGIWHATTWCRVKRSVVCAWRPDCQEGWIGEECNKRCHCYKENCRRHQRFCKYGCETGWAGDNCTQEVTPPIVEHYCVKYRTHYALLLSKNENSPDTGSLVPLDQEGYPINPDQYTEGFNGSDVFEISTSDLSLPFKPNYHERKIDSQGTTFDWTFRLSQFKNARTLADLNFRVRCNFSEADVMFTSAAIDFDIASLGHPSTSSPLAMKLDVNITIADSKDGNNLADVTVGQPIKVVMSQQATHAEDDTVEEDAGQLMFLSPRSCEARSPDNRVVKQLSDERGCRLEPGLTRWFDIPPENGEIVTRPFAAFGMPGSTGMKISCALVACTYHDWGCKQPCDFH